MRIKGIGIDGWVMDEQGKLASGGRELVVRPSSFLSLLSSDGSSLDSCQASRCRPTRPQEEPRPPVAASARRQAARGGPRLELIVPAYRP